MPGIEWTRRELYAASPIRKGSPMWIKQRATECLCYAMSQVTSNHNTLSVLLSHVGNLIVLRWMWMQY